MMFFKVIGYMGSIASIISVFFLNPNWATWQVVIIIVLILISIASLIYTIVDYKRKRPIECKNDDEIKKYMYDWINTSGKVSIYSRDLSWVDKKIKKMLKSKGADLNICAEKETSLTKDLRKSNVNIYLYGDTGFTPASRFTIIRANKPEKQIAIATVNKKRYKEKHTIYETSNGYTDKWLLALSTDLVEITKCLDQLVKENHKNNGADSYAIKTH